MKRKNEMALRRGEIYFYDYGVNEGSIQCGRRPVVIMQSEEFNGKAPTVIVAAITTAIKKRYLPSHVLLGQQFGLERPSMVLLEQIRTINKSDLEDYVGYIDDLKIRKIIDNAVKKTFGLWIYKDEKQDEIRTLCSKCLKDYFANPLYRVRRRDPFDPVKHTCDKCDGMGYEYIVYENGKHQKKKQILDAYKNLDMRGEAK